MDFIYFQVLLYTRPQKMYVLIAPRYTSISFFCTKGFARKIFTTKSNGSGVVLAAFLL